MGLTPMSPVMSEEGTVLMPVFARITKSPAEFKSSGNSGLPPCAATAVSAIIPIVKTLFAFIVVLLFGRLSI